MSHIFKIKMVLGFLLVILCFSNVFFVLWEISQGIPRPPAFFISPAVLGITMVILLLSCLCVAQLSPVGTLLVFPMFFSVFEHKDS